MKILYIIAICFLVASPIQAKQILNIDDAKEQCTSLIDSFVETIAKAKVLGVPKEKLVLEGKDNMSKAALQTIIDAIYKGDSQRVKTAIVVAYQLCIKVNTEDTI